MGVYLAPELIERGFLVDITSRNKHNNSGDTHFIQGDAKDNKFLKKLLKNRRYDVIVDFMVYSTEDFEARYKMLLDGCSHYIFLSSYRVFADAGVITEESPRLLDVSTDKNFLLTNDYSLEKARQEDILKSAKMRNWTIVRPSITYSRNRFQLGTLEADTVIWRPLNNKPVVLPRGMLNKQTTMTWAGDVAKMIALLALNKKAMADDFNVVTSEHLSWRQVAEIYKNAIGLNIVAVNRNRYIKALGGGFNKYQVNYDRMFNRVIDNSKILETVGLKQHDLIGTEEGLTRELIEFIKNPRLGNIDYDRQERIDALIDPRVKLDTLRKKAKIRTRLRSLKRKLL